MGAPRKTLWGLLGLSLAAVCALGASCKGRATGPGVSPESTATRGPIRLFFVTDLDGYLEPCGCTARPLGGIDRLAQELQRSSQGAAGTLILASGDLFFEHPRLDDDMVWQERQKATSLTGILNGLALAAWVPGPSDFAQGPHEFARLRGALRAEALGANAGLGGGLVREVGGVRVGLVGVTDLRPTSGDAAAGAPATQDPIAATRREVAAVRARGAEVVVVLASLPRRQARMIAGDVPGVDFVIAARNDAPSAPPPERLGSAYLLTAASQGRGLGVVDLWVRGGGGFTDASEATRRAERARLDARIADLQRRLDAWSREPGTDANALASQRARLAEMQRQREASARVAAPTSGRWFDARAVEVSADVPRATSVQQQIARYYREVNDHNRAAFADRRAPPAAPGAASYAGTESCRECHEDAFAVWQHTRHAHAYRTLEVASKNFNLSCVGCHVTGYRQPGGSEVVQNEGLRDVQCEACHGPGSLHIEARGHAARVATIRRTVDATFCATQCHTPEHSDHFNYERYLPFILGPGHGRPEGSPMPDPDASAAHLGEADATAH
ncbi:MAG: multiheme c-type cytochrome [Polyangiales bacterium]